MIFGRGTLPRGGEAAAIAAGGFLQETIVISICLADDGTVLLQGKFRRACPLVRVRGFL